MPAKTNMSTPTLSSLMLRLGLIDFVQICIKNLSAVKFHFNKRAINCYLLAVPFTNGLRCPRLAAAKV
jgi:hypothetical protein